MSSSSHCILAKRKKSCVCRSHRTESTSSDFQVFKRRARQYIVSLSYHVLGCLPACVRLGCHSRIRFLHRSFGKFATRLFTSNNLPKICPPNFSWNCYCKCYRTLSVRSVRNLMRRVFPPSAWRRTHTKETLVFNIHPMQVRVVNRSMSAPKPATTETTASTNF